MLINHYNSRILKGSKEIFGTPIVIPPDALYANKMVHHLNREYQRMSDIPSEGPIDWPRKWTLYASAPVGVMEEGGFFEKAKDPRYMVVDPKDFTITAYIFLEAKSGAVIVIRLPLDDVNKLGYRGTCPPKGLLRSWVYNRKFLNRKALK